MAIRQTNILKKMKGKTFSTKKDNSIFIACYVDSNLDMSGKIPSRGVWTYKKYYFTPNKRTKMIKLASSFLPSCVPMTCLQKYGPETVHHQNKKNGSAIPLAVYNFMHSQLQNNEINWLNFEKAWLNTHMLNCMRDFYTGKVTISFSF